MMFLVRETSQQSFQGDGIFNKLVLLEIKICQKMLSVGFKIKIVQKVQQYLKYTNF